MENAFVSRCLFPARIGIIVGWSTNSQIDSLVIKPIAINVVYADHMAHTNCTHNDLMHIGYLPLLSWNWAASPMGHGVGVPPMNNSCTPIVLR